MLGEVAPGNENGLLSPIATAGSEFPKLNILLADEEDWLLIEKSNIEVASLPMLKEELPPTQAGD